MEAKETPQKTAEKAVEAQSATSSDSAVPENKSTAKKKSLIGMILGGIILLILILVGAYFLMRQKPDTTTATEGKVYHVGILSGLDFFLPTIDGFKKKMTELGYVEGKNVVYDIQKTNFEPVREKAILEKFVSDRDDLIFTFPTEVSLAAKEVTKGTKIPVVFGDAYTEGVNLVDNISRPGGNITGVRFPGAEISIKRLEYVHEILPNAKRIWVTYQKDYPPVPPMMQKLRAAATSMNLTLVEVPALSANDVIKDLDARSKLAKPGVDVMFTATEPLAVEPQVFNAIVKFAAEQKLMIADSIVIPGDTGPVFSNFPESAESGVEVATLADKIFKGIPAGTIPVVSPEIHLKINNKVAQKLGITLSEGFLSQAVEVLH